MIEYRGYTAVLEFDPSVDRFHGRVIGLQDVVTFEGRSIDELRREMEESIEDYLDFCAKVGKEPERPYRGEFIVRTTPEIHRAVATAAEAQGMSLNAWVESTLTDVASQVRPVPRGKAKRAATGLGRRDTTAGAKKSRTRASR